jgi:Tfp pilus assembly ATPase PilU
MSNKYHSERINFVIHPEDRIKLQKYAESQQKSISMVLRDYIKKLPVVEE